MTDLPASLEAAWGFSSGPGKGPKRALSVQQIAAAGVTVADADGLGAVSMTRVAAELGAATMALYRYVSAKDELLMLMVDEAFGPPPSSASDGDWRAGLTRWSHLVLTAYRQHPWVLAVPMVGPPTTPHQLAWLEMGLSSLRDTGLTPADRLAAMILVAGFVRDHARLTGAMAQTPDVMIAYATLLAKVVATGRFPELHTVMASGVMAQDQPGEDPQFDFSLKCILDGIAALLTS